MATVIYAEDGPTGYIELINKVINKGVSRESRNGDTRELGFTVVEILDTTRAYPVGVGRGLNRRIVAAEALQLVGAFSDPDLLGVAFEPYKEADGRFWGAYGDRIGYQLLDVVRKLRQTSETRQAIISLWNPQLDNVPFKQDYPCTLTLTFSVNPDGQLDLSVHMRSNDVWLGVPYDWGQFSVLQQTVATLIGRTLGRYRHVVDSMHLYKRNLEAALLQIHKTPEVVGDDSFPPGLARTDDRPTDVIRRCRTLPYVNGSYVPKEHWYRNAVNTEGYVKYGTRESPITG